MDHDEDRKKEIDFNSNVSKVGSTKNTYLYNALDDR